jgi:protein-L-isoaspartate(D-aspartate) O-methyltransferase
MAYEKQRHAMVEYQLKARGIRDERVLDAMERVERHLFVGDSQQDRAYDDCALPIGENQTISQPYMVALMTELLELRGTEKILEIGTGSGYQGAVLSLLAAEVFTMERIESLTLNARNLFRKLGYDNIHTIVGDGSLGLSEHALFDGIIVTAAAPEIPTVYIEQLNTDGILVIPVGSRYSQMLYKVKNTPSGTNSSIATACVFVPLIGKYGW